MLSRDALRSGAFFTLFQNVPGMEGWSRERIEHSMRETLAHRPDDSPVWLFAYGSLIWNPLFHFVESCPAQLDGWRRSFCIRMLAGRGSVERCGRMMSLVQGGCTQGLALRLDETQLETELTLVWSREMVGGAYRPDWATITLADGRAAPAIIFMANPDSALHEPDDSIDTVAPLIAAAEGPLGSNRDYVLQLDTILRRHGIEDAYVRTLAQRLKSRSP